MLYLYDIMLVQEAHCGEFKETFTESRIDHSHACFWSSDPHTASTGGVGIIINRRLLAMFGEQPVWEELVRGRIAALRLRGASGGLDIFTVHLEPALPTSGYITQLSLLRAAIKPYAEAHSFLAGDWNFDLDEEDRFDPEAGHFCGRRGEVATWWDRHFGEFLEWYQGDFTRSGSTRTLNKSLSRLDRIYSNLAPADALDWKVSAAIVGALETSAEKLSDHLPVHGRMSKMRRSSQSHPIPAWVVQHSCWHDKLQARYKEWAAAQTETDVWTKLRDIKALFRKAEKDVINVTKNRGAKTTDEKFYWALRALRGIKNYNPGMLEEAVKAFPGLCEFVDCFDLERLSPRRIDKLKDEIKRLAQVGIEEKAKELESIKNLPEYDRERRQRGLARWAAKWSPKQRKAMGLAGVRMQNGSITTDPDEACKELGSYWADTFAEKPIDTKAAERFLQQWAVQLPSISWELDQAQFMKVIASTADTAPGPDGVPYAAWRNAPKEVLQILFDVYKLWIQGGEVPDDFNYSYLALIPKGSHDDDPRLLARAPGETRPLSLSNSDCKILANALQIAIEDAIGRWAIRAQRGFIKGRKMLQNIMEAETRAMKLANSLEHRAALIFLDFGAAFPSLSHTFLWMVLEHVGFPAVVIAAIKKLYRHNRHWIRFGGACVEAFTIMSGVKQGCPLSPLLFVIATDPFLRALEAAIAPRSLVRGYADNIALVLQNVWKEAEGVSLLFNNLAKMSGLHLKPKKCVLIPLWPCMIGRAFSALLKEQVPTWADFQIDVKGKYLGVWLGPGAGTSSWDEPLRKYVTQAEYIASLKLGLAMTALLYRIFALSAFSFVVQICPIPERVLEQERKVLRMLVPGPGNWISKTSLHNLDVLFGLPTSFPSLAVWGLAAKARVGISDLEGCTEQRLCISRAMVADDAPLEHRWRQWFSSSIACTIDGARTQLVSMRLLEPNSGNLPGRGKKPKLLPGLQSALYKALRLKLLPTDLYTILRSRLERWDSKIDAPLGIAARRAERVVAHLENKVPPCVLAALARSWLNGWCTARRFQQGNGKCWLCEECTGDDSIEHYSRCHWSWHTAQRRLRIDSTLRGIGPFLLLESCALKDTPLLALNLYAVYSATNYFRSLGRRGRMGEAHQHMAASYTKAGLLSQHLAKRIRNVWDRQAS
jgi:hypothetical protein